MVKEGVRKRGGTVREWWDGKKEVWEMAGMVKEWWDGKKGCGRGLGW